MKQKSETFSIFCLKTSEIFSGFVLPQQLTCQFFFSLWTNFSHLSLQSLLPDY